LDKILGMVNLLSIQRIYPTSHPILLLVLLCWFLIFIWALPVEVSQLLAYKTSPLVLVTFSCMKFPAGLAFRDGSLAFVIHFFTLSSF
jgi:hypothetical protein